MSNEITIYFAGPLFTQGEWLWNVTVTELLRGAGIDVILPQEGSIPMMSGEEKFDAKLLFDTNVASIERSDAVVAILDQTDPDSGTAWECGYAYKLGKPIFGVRSDFRIAGDDGDLPVNLMLARSCSGFLNVPIARRTDTEWVAEQIAANVRAILGRPASR
jgi:nucleoside 2-deoxyribosyltransferase